MILLCQFIQLGETSNEIVVFAGFLDRPGALRTSPVKRKEFLFMFRGEVYVNTWVSGCRFGWGGQLVTKSQDKGLGISWDRRS